MTLNWSLNVINVSKRRHKRLNSLSSVWTDYNPPSIHIRVKYEVLKLQRSMLWKKQRSWSAGSTTLFSFQHRYLYLWCVFYSKWQLLVIFQKFKVLTFCHFCETFRRVKEALESCLRKCCGFIIFISSEKTADHEAWESSSQSTSYCEIRDMRWCN